MPARNHSKPNPRKAGMAAIPGSNSAWRNTRTQRHQNRTRKPPAAPDKTCSARNPLHHLYAWAASIAIYCLRWAARLCCSLPAQAMCGTSPPPATPSRCVPSRLGNPRLQQRYRKIVRLPKSPQQLPPTAGKKRNWRMPCRPPRIQTVFKTAKNIIVAVTQAHTHRAATNRTP